MTETIVGAFIGACITFITTIVNAHIENKKRKVEIEQKHFETKRDKLSNIYENLISIINSYPHGSPNDILECIECPPNYSLESFDSIIMTLEYQIEDYKKKLSNDFIGRDKEQEFEVEVSNREYLIKQIVQIRDDYFNAENKFKEFCKIDKVKFDLYAGQEVKNSLERFRKIKHNIFKSGMRVGDIDDPTNNLIDQVRREIVNCMRNDIGII